MKNVVRFDESKVCDFVTNDELLKAKEAALAAQKVLNEGTGEGSDFVGWVDLPVNYDKVEFDRIKKAAARINGDSQALVVIGIGGSYLGARAVIEALSHNFANIQAEKDGKATQVFFVGNNISSTYIADLLEVLDGKDISVNVISKSGTTTEPAIAFRIFKELLEEKYGKAGAAKRIYVTTDKARGALKTLGDAEGYEEYVVPDDIGGRYSFLTAVGLLPIAVAGIDIDALMKGAADMREIVKNAPFEENDSLKYAAYRNIFLGKGKSVEIVANYEPALHFVAEWWKQLYGESEGKDGKGLLPASLDLTADLHSMGQFIQQGTRIMFETVLDVEKARKELVIKSDRDDLDGLNYIAGKSVDYVNKYAMYGTLLAHTDGDVPNLMIHIPTLEAEYIGQLLYFFEYACGVSGYMLGVNPFNQPGVESYKKNMFALLGKPGYEAEGDKLRERLR